MDTFDNFSQISSGDRSARADSDLRNWSNVGRTSRNPIVRSPTFYDRIVSLRERGFSRVPGILLVPNRRGRLKFAEAD